MERLTTCGWEPRLWKAGSGAGTRQGSTRIDLIAFSWKVSKLGKWSLNRDFGLLTEQLVRSRELKNYRLILRVHLPGGSRWMVKPERSEVKARGILEAHEILRARGV